MEPSPDMSQALLVVAGTPGGTPRLVHPVVEVHRPAACSPVAGSVMSLDFDVYCLAMPTTFELTAPFSFTYDAGSDSLTDSTGVVWSRAGS